MNGDGLAKYNTVDQGEPLICYDGVPALTDIDRQDALDYLASLDQLVSDTRAQLE